MALPGFPGAESKCIGLMLIKYNHKIKVITYGPYLFSLRNVAAHDG